LKSSNAHQTAPVILAFEASTKQLSVAVHVDGAVLAMQKIEAPFGQAAELVPLAMRTLADVGVEFSSLSHVAAGCGPGSFTGLRVSLAAAKGVCLARDIVGLGISGLEALAFSSSEVLNGLPVLCIADTRRGNVYAQLFASDMTPQGAIFEAQIEQLPFLVPASVCEDGLMLAGFGGLDAEVAFAANGLKAKPVFFGNKEDVSIVDAGMIATMAAKKIRLGDIPPLVPIYLADPRLGPKKKKLVT
jgi:tRNA threonylcarbamoyladenosine biosynthesis protein TsaB